MIEPRFLTKLQVTLLDSRGNGAWELLAAFIYLTDLLENVVVVPAGFVTDFASVPRLPFVYSLLGNVGHEAAVLHDWLYSPKCEQKRTRAQADAVLREAALLAGVPEYKAQLMWLAVRMFGWQFYKAE